MRLFHAAPLSALALSLACAPAVRAQSAQADRSAAERTEPAAGEARREDPRRLPADKTVRLKIDVAGQSLPTAVTAGSLPFFDDKGVAQAEYAYVAYVLEGADPERRPVVYVVNGGPGAGSAWLHLGALGPWRIDLEGVSPSQPARLLANAESWLPFADLVFFDPPGTGAAPLLDEGAKKKFWSVSGDVDRLAEAIRRWTQANERMASPKFFVGESYGGFRGPRVAASLIDKQGMGLSGLVLISPILDFMGIFGGPGDLLSYVGRLPSFAASARPGLGEAERREIEAYAAGDYLTDLARGVGDPAVLDRMSKKVADITGMDYALVRRLGGRVSKEAFLEQSLRAHGKARSYFDGQATGYDPQPFAYERDYADPVADAAPAALSTAMLDLYARKIGWAPKAAYQTLNGSVSAAWDWGRSLNAPESVKALNRLLALDPRLKVRVIQGDSDLQTPYFANKLLLAQTPDYGAPGRLTLKALPGGHMFYGREAGRRALRDEARALIEGK